MAANDLLSFNELVQEVIGGAVSRHTFNQWQIELLLDLNSCRIRKSARPNVLRSYLREVHQGFAEGAATPLRFSSFMERYRRHRSPGAPRPPAAVHASTGA